MDTLNNHSKFDCYANERRLRLIFTGGFVAGLSVVVAVTYVAGHFIVKYW